LSINDFNLKEFDTLIINATVFDGSGKAANYESVGIVNDKIVAIGDITEYKAKQVIDATGLVLAPGFIDVHTHDDLELIRNPDMLAKVSQGVTTVIIGNCGISASPYLTDFSTSRQPLPDPINLLGKQSEFKFPSLEQYIAKLVEQPANVNVAALVGHTSLRAQVMSNLSNAANDSEIELMSQLLQTALAQGAKGLSTGLAYRNANAANTKELLTLVSQLKAYDGIYTTHLRTEFDEIIDALDEAFHLGKQAEIPVIISHLKCAGTNNWGRSDEIIKHIEQRQSSQKIACDCYPYHASSSTLDLKQVTDEFEIFITWSEAFPDMAGQTLQAIADRWKVTLLAAAEKLQPAGAVYHGMDESDVKQFLQMPSSMIGSDGLPCDPHPHPRLWGSFPRVLGRYSRDKKLFSLAKAIHKMTGLSANEFKLSKRGLIQQGYFADLVLFDANTISDCADFTNPFELSHGIQKVWLNGEITYQQQGVTTFAKQRPGRFLKHKFEEVTHDN